MISSVSVAAGAAFFGAGFAFHFLGDRHHGNLAVGANYAGIFNFIAGGTSIYGVGIEDAYMVQQKLNDVLISE